MEVDKDMMLGSLLHGTLVEVHHPLVATVHEVNLHALHAPFGKLGKETGILLHATPCEPEHHADAHLLAVSKDFHQVAIGIGCVGVHIVLCPTLVHDDVLDAIMGGKVHEVFVGLHIKTGAEVDILAIGHGTVPPLPTGLSGLNPGGVVQTAVLRKTACHGVGDEVGLVLGDDKIAPWEVAGALGKCDVWLTQKYVGALVATRLFHGRNAREDGRETSGIVATEEGAGIVLKVGLAHENLSAARSDGQDGVVRHGMMALPLCRLDEGVSLLVGSLVMVALLKHEVGLLWQEHGDVLVVDLHLAGERCGETVGNAIVVGTERHGVATLHLEREFVVVVGHLCKLQV